MITITRKFEFAAGHYLPNHPGACKRYHGHNYLLEVTVSRVGGYIHPATKMVIDFGDLKKIVNKNIVDILDHSWLNDLFDNPTAEYMVHWMTIILKRTLPDNIELQRIRLYETSNSYIDWRKYNV